MLEYLLITFAGIFVIVNPLTTAFVFMSLLSGASDSERQRVAWRATVVATSIFFTFALLGGLIFQLFGITLEAFRIAGGLILFGIAMTMIGRGRDSGGSDLSTRPDGTMASDVSVIPLAIPFISGPGSIATVMILTSEAPTIWHTSLVFLAVIAATAACYYSMIYSRVVVRYLGESGREIITRIFGLILAVIAVQFVINGVVDVVQRIPGGA